MIRGFYKKYISEAIYCIYLHHRPTGHYNITKAENSYSKKNLAHFVHTHISHTNLEHVCHRETINIVIGTIMPIRNCRELFKDFS